MQHPQSLGKKIVLAMLFGAILGLLLHRIPGLLSIKIMANTYVFQVGGHLFIALIRMLVVPIVLVSLMLGCANLAQQRCMGKLAGLTLMFYLLTTALAITLALLVAHFLHVGELGAPLNYPAETTVPTSSSVVDTIKQLVPNNPIMAMSQGRLLQVIVFSILMGLALGAIKKQAQQFFDLVEQVNQVIMQLITMIMQLAPIGVFCLMASLFSEKGFGLVGHLVGYFFAVLLTLLLQGAGVYSGILYFFAQLNPIVFFRKMMTPMTFAFSVSSSSASIPIVLKTVQNDLGVSPSIASFVIPMGATINMDGTAIMQGIATVFIAHAYHVPLGLGDYLTVIVMATMASVGAAGVPGVGLVTLAMVLRQVNLPVEGIALIIGVDRLLDMARTAVNVCGDAMIACMVARWSGLLDRDRFS